MHADNSFILQEYTVCTIKHTNQSSKLSVMLIKTVIGINVILKHTTHMRIHAWHNKKKD